MKKLLLNQISLALFLPLVLVIIFLALSIINSFFDYSGPINTFLENEEAAKIGELLLLVNITVVPIVSSILLFFKSKKLVGWKRIVTLLLGFPYLLVALLYFVIAGCGSMGCPTRSIFEQLIILVDILIILLFSFLIFVPLFKGRSSRTKI